MGSRSRVVRHGDVQARSCAISGEHLDVVYKYVEDAVENTNTDGKSTDEIFGEIFTRFRTEVALYGRDAKLQQLFRTKLKRLDWTSVGQQLNDIINELYLDRLEDTIDISGLKLSECIVQDCVEEAKTINTQAGTAVSELEKIHQELNGEENE